MSPKRFALSRVVLAAALFAALVLALGRPPAQANQPPGLTTLPANPPTDQIIVRFRDAADPTALTAAAETQMFARLSAAAGVSLQMERPMSGDAYVLQLPQALPQSEVAAISARLTALPEVEYAEPDAIMQLVARPAQAAPAADLTPDDSRFADQWHYRYVPGDEEGLNLLPAWGIATGSADSVVAVIDTGIRPHADLSGRILSGYDFIADPFVANDGNGRDADPSDPGDWVTTNECPFPNSAADSSWHGTHVAGTIAANSNNASDVAGVNWAAKILPLRVLGKCGGYLSDITDATRWAAGLAVPGVPANANPAQVVNLSLGGGGACGATYQNAFNELAAAGVVSVVAAGNSGANASAYRPANCNQVITVAATTKTGDQSYYTNFGAVVEIAAPGGEQYFFNDPNGVLSTLNAGLTGPGADNLVYYQGTSMAAPHVAGLASLLLGEQPALTPAEVLDILQTTARDFPAGSNCTPAKCGTGIADAYAALSALAPALEPPVLVAPADGATVLTDSPTLQWSAVDGASEYRLHVATDAAFNDLVVNEGGLTVLSHFVAGLANGQYWWRVRAEAGDPGPWSEVWSFTVDVPPCETPAVPALLWPEDTSHVNETQPTFTWEAVDNVTGYEFAIGLVPGMEEGNLYPTSQPEFTPPDPLDFTTYYWRVRALNQSASCDLASDWSATWSVTVDAPPTYQVFLPIILSD
jgi:serine protease